MIAVLTESVTLDRRAERNRALLAAERVREQATREANVEYSETVEKLRERFELELAEACERRRRRIVPAQRAYNAAVVAAESSIDTAPVKNLR